MLWVTEGTHLPGTSALLSFAEANREMVGKREQAEYFLGEKPKPEPPLVNYFPAQK
jgi:hypothetical protein